MFLKHLSLTNFRNFTRLDIDVPPRVVLLVGANAQGKTSVLEAVSKADWGPDGGNLAVIRHDGPKPRLEFPIGRVLYVSESWISCPRVSPKGDRVAFKERISGVRTDEGVALRVVDLSGKTTTLASLGHWLGVAWLPKGNEVWFSDWGILRAVTLGGRQRVLTRFPGPITINDVSPDGRVLVTTAQWYGALTVGGPGETRERDLAWFDRAHVGALSRDGKKLLFSDGGRGSGSPDPPHTYLRATDGSPAVRLGERQALSLSPDG